jgi:hypothetical protein
VATKNQKQKEIETNLSQRFDFQKDSQEQLKNITIS